MADQARGRPRDQTDHAAVGPVRVAQSGGEVRGPAARDVMRPVDRGHGRDEGVQVRDVGIGDGGRIQREDVHG